MRHPRFIAKTVGTEDTLVLVWGPAPVLRFRPRSRGATPSRGADDGLLDLDEMVMRGYVIRGDLVGSLPRQTVDRPGHAPVTQIELELGSHRRLAIGAHEQTAQDVALIVPAHDRPFLDWSSPGGKVAHMFLFSKRGCCGMNRLNTTQSLVLLAIVLVVGWAISIIVFGDADAWREDWSRFKQELREWQDILFG